MRRIKFFIQITAFGAVSFLISCSEEQPRPIADFSFPSNEKNETSSADISFTNLSKNANAYVWDFGDGTMSYEKTPRHSYMVKGTYVVELIAVGLGGRHAVTKELVITSDLKGIWKEVENSKTGCANTFLNHGFQDCDNTCETIVFSPSTIFTTTGDNNGGDHMRYRENGDFIEILGYSQIYNEPFFYLDDIITYSITVNTTLQEKVLTLTVQRSVAHGSCRVTHTFIKLL